MRACKESDDWEATLRTLNQLSNSSNQLIDDLHKNQEYSAVRGFLSHMLSKETGRTKCTICSIEFTRESNLIAHESSHTGVKHARCATCNKEFLSQSYVKAEESTQTGLKPYRCSKCNKEFLRKFSLTTHEMLHIGAAQMSHMQ